jgi:hypothetical protein
MSWRSADGSSAMGRHTTSSPLAVARQLGKAGNRRKSEEWEGSSRAANSAPRVPPNAGALEVHPTGVASRQRMKSLAKTRQVRRQASRHAIAGGRGRRGTIRWLRAPATIYGGLAGDPVLCLICEDNLPRPKLTAGSLFSAPAVRCSTARHTGRRKARSLFCVQPKGRGLSGRASYSEGRDDHLPLILLNILASGPGAVVV